MSAPAGGIPKVSGRMRAMAVLAWMPGSAPPMKPHTVPSAMRARLCQENASRMPMTRASHMGRYPRSIPSGTSWSKSRKKTR